MSIFEGTTCSHSCNLISNLLEAWTIGILSPSIALVIQTVSYAGGKEFISPFMMPFIRKISKGIGDDFELVKLTDRNLGEL